MGFAELPPEGAVLRILDFGVCFSFFEVLSLQIKRPSRVWGVRFDARMIFVLFSIKWRRGFVELFNLFAFNVKEEIKVICCNSSGLIWRDFAALAMGDTTVLESIQYRCSWGHFSPSVSTLATSYEELYFNQNPILKQVIL